MTTRPTAFARVPRGSKKDTTPRKDLVKIDANFLERLERANMPPDLSTIMTKTSSTLDISINAQANIGYSLTNKESKVVADQADIKRIQTMSTSITKERKAALGEEMGIATRFTLAAFVQKSEELGEVPTIQRFHKNFVAIYRTVNTQYQTIAKNLSAIEAVNTTDDGSEKVKNVFIEMGRRISIAVGKFLFYRATLAEDAAAEKLNVYLFREFVPIWIFSKLSAALIATTAQGFDLRHLLFPKDPSKGISLTFKEIRSAEFRNRMYGLLAGSQLMIQLAMDDTLIRLMINLPETTPIDNFDVANSVAMKMAGTPFFLLPFEGAVEVTDMFNFLAKNGVRGVTWVSGTVLTPVDLLKFYGTIAKRIAYCLLVRPQNKATLLRDMFEGFTYDPASDQQDIFAQLKAWSLRPGSTPSWFSKVCGWADDAPYRIVLRQVFNDVTMVSGDHGIATEFQSLTRRAAIPVSEGVLSTGPWIFTEVKNLAVSLRERHIDPMIIIGDRISLPKKREKALTNRAGAQERSRLSTVSRDAIQQLRTRGFTALALRMQSWFRLFLDETIQEAVAGIFLARLESFLDAPLELTREDRQGFMEPDEPERARAPAEPEEESDPEEPINPDEN